MAIKNGGDFLISVGGTAVEDLVSIGFDSSMEARDITTKDSSGGKREIAEGKLSYTINFEGLYDEAATLGFDSLWTSMEGRSSVTFIVDSGAGSGEINYSGSGYITALSLSGGNEGENVTYSGTLEVTGDITPNTVT